MEQQQPQEQRVLRVGNTTAPKELAKSIFASYTKENLKRVTLRAIGAAAVNQAMKSIILANQDLSSKGIQGRVTPHFKDVAGSSSDEKKITAIELVIIFDEL
jgi:stage V sporulation protein SpoVS